MPADARGSSNVKEWLFERLLQSGRKPVLVLLRFSGDTDETPMRKFFDTFLEARLPRMEPVLAASGGSSFCAATVNKLFTSE
jgi:glutathione S-transferase